MVPPRPSGVVFDMDGLLLDSERLAMEYFVAACREHSIDPDMTIYRRCIGTREEDTQRILTQGYGPQFPLESIQARWNELYETHIRELPVPIKAGALALLDRCAELGIRCGLATSTSGRLARKKLESAGLLERFEILVTGDMVERAKPDPEAYLKAARALKLRPSACWALEDSDIGVRSALAAGFMVYQVPDMIAAPVSVAEPRHTIVASLQDVRKALDHSGGS